MEISKVIEVLNDLKNISPVKGQEALSSAISLIQDYQKLKEEIDRLRVQLAGCGVAALGYATGKNTIEKGSYGYSASFQDVVDLQDKYQKLRERVGNKDKIEEIIHSISFWHQGKSTYLDYKKECHYCNDRPWLNKISQSIVTYLQQPTEH